MSVRTIRTDASGTSTFGYDTAGRLKTLNDGATGSTATYGYDVNSNVTSIDYGTGKAKRTFGYDKLQRPTTDTLTSPTGKTLASFTYGWDANDNLTSKTTTGLTGSTANTYTYDWADRVTSWNNGTTTEVYGYDASGNRTRVGGDTYTYDARNRLTSDGHSAYTYTARGTLSSVTDEASRVTNMKVDAFNRVIQEGNRTYTYDGLDRVLNAKDETGSSLYSFQYAGAGNDVASDGVTSYSRDAAGGLIGVKTAASAVLALTDLHTDVVAQFTTTGEALTGSTTYSPFGKVLQTAGMAGALGYQSGWTDPATAKVNMAARWYSPETGQFNSRDTVGLSGIPTSISANRYAYADGNPMTGMDPTGHWPDWADKIVKKVKKKVKKTVKSAYKKVKKAVKKVAKVVKKAAKKVKRAVKKAVKRAKRAVRKAVRYVADSVKKVKRYVKRVYKRVKRVAHKVVKHVKKAVRKVAKAVKHVAKKVVKAAKKVGRAVKKAAKATANFVKQHASTIASVATGIAVFAGCTAITAGVGAVGCAALAGAAANGVGYMMSDGPKSVGGFLGAVAIGAVTGAAGGVGGRLAASAAGKLLSGTAGKIATNAAEEAGSEALTGAVEYGTSCVNSEEGCSVAGAAKAATIGAVMGGAFGAKGKGNGPKSTASPGSGSGGGCPVRRGKVPHSFTGKTPVLMADGKTKEIAEVKVGDKVMTAEPGKKTKEVHEVKEVIVTKTDRDYVDVSLATKSGRKTIQTTEHHQFYESTLNAWTQAGDLQVGQKLQNGEGAPTAIVEVKSYKADRTTYDLSIEGLHTYFVFAGDTVMAADPGSAVLVHNCGGGFDASGAPCSCASPRPAVWELDAIEHPDSAIHAAEQGGDGMMVTMDRPGAETRRQDNLRGVPTQPGMDRDEFPPAAFKEGKGAHVKHIISSDNRGSGSTIRHQLSDVPNGGRVMIRIIGLDYILGRGRRSP
ncbi:RHS repeat-associated core domain-containing protein [Streptomyces roseolus]|uniref:RHS repeat-associated core domain-containing protein n=1 Tax=Streptomyces roseolus TaxID=67358 RepID=UPI003666D532